MVPARPASAGMRAKDKPGALGARKRSRASGPPPLPTVASLPRKGIFSLSPYRRPRVGDGGERPWQCARASSGTWRRWVVGRGRPHVPFGRFVIGAGPAGLTAAYLLTKSGRSDHGHRGRPDLRRRHQPHRQLQGLPVRHRRAPLLLQVQGGRGPLEGDPARRLHRAPAPLAHLLQRQVFSYPLKAFEALQQPRATSRAALCVLSFLQKQAFPTANPENFHDWVPTSSASGCSRSSSRPTPRRCGA